MFVQTRLLSLGLLVAMCALIAIRIKMAMKGKLPHIRRIPALEAIPEAVGRATELGKPVVFVPGIGSLDTDVAPQTMAGLEILGHTAKVAADYRAKLVVPIRDAVVYPIAEEVVKQGCLKAGAPDAFATDTVRFLSTEQFAFAAGTMGIIQRDKAAANIMVGAFFGESLLLLESSNQTGAIVIGGTARMFQLPFFAMVCDYVLLGEEMFVGSAYLTKDPVGLGSTVAQDWIKFAVVGTLILGAVLRTMGNPVLFDFVGRFGR